MGVIFGNWKSLPPACLILRKVGFQVGVIAFHEIREDGFFQGEFAIGGIGFF